MQRPIFNKSCQQFLALPNYNFQVISRTVTDIPWYKIPDESHLHIVDGRSTRRKFDLKIQKLEKQRLAAERRLQFPTKIKKPSELPEIQVPNFIERGPSDILRAIGGCIKRDFTAPDYKFHDDPFLIPYNVVQKKDYLLSKQSGKRAARYVLNQHGDLFNKNLIEMEPKIKSLLPRTKVSEKNATPALLQSLIEACNVTDAKLAYEILTKGNVEISSELKQEYLEMLCFHNSNDEELEEDYNDYKGTLQDQPSRWVTGGAADHIANEIMKSEGLKSEAANKARLALMLGKAKFKDFKGVQQIYEDIKANDGKVDTLGYNALILATVNKKDVQWEDVKNLLTEMSEESVKPDRTTLLHIFQGISNSKQPLSTYLSILAEFKILGVEPCLGVYRELLFATRNGPNLMIIKDVISELSKIQEAKGTLVHEIVSDECFTFFCEAMRVAKDKSLLDVAHKINDLIMADPNDEVLRGGFFEANGYHQAFLDVLMAKEPLETFVKYLDLYTPHVWSPPLMFYNKYLRVIKDQSAPQHLPTLWTDMVSCEFTRSPIKARVEFLCEFGKVMRKLGSDGDEVLHTTFGKIAEDMFNNVEKNYTGLRTMMKTGHDEQLFNLSLDLCLQFNNTEAARKIVKFFKENYTEIEGELGGDVMKRFGEVMIEEKDYNEVYSAIILANQFKHVQIAEKLAVLAGKRLEFEKQQKQALNSLFSSSSKWKML